MARNKYPEVTVEKILDAAQRLFLEKGYENTTIQDIVNELGGLTKGAVYHHFKSKEEIMDAVNDRMFFSNNPFEAVQGRGDLSGLEKRRRLNHDALPARALRAAAHPDQPLVHPPYLSRHARGAKAQVRIHPRYARRNGTPTAQPGSRGRDRALLLRLA